MLSSTLMFTFALAELIRLPSFSLGFLIQNSVVRPSRTSRAFWTWQSAFASSVEHWATETDHEEESDFSLIRAPLKYVGPYPCLGVRFPDLATTAQRQRNESGVTLDFVLDTAANTNTINAQVAQELSLNVTGQALPGMGSAGPIQGDLPTYYLGDMQLEGLGRDIFMQNVTASALPVASPATAGLLSLAFFQSIGGGIDFDWRGDVESGVPPSISFYAAEAIANATRERVCVHMDRIPITQLPSVEIEINGHVFPALLDTGSPVTVLNAKAARVAGVETVVPNDSQTRSRNPLAALSGRFQQAQAASRGQVLSIFGMGGKRVNLIQSADKVSLRLPTNEREELVDFGDQSVYVGDLPGLAALQGLGVDAPPAVVLGMDVLRSKRRMFFRPLANEVWFEHHH